MRGEFFMFLTGPGRSSHHHAIVRDGSNHSGSRPNGCSMTNFTTGNHCRVGPNQCLIPHPYGTGKDRTRGDVSVSTDDGVMFDHRA